MVSRRASGAETVKLGALTPTRDLSYVGDTAGGMIAALDSPRTVGETINLGSGHEIAMGELAETIARLMGRKARIVTEQADKQAAFRVARAALAKSGTVTLELALSGVPMVAAYKVSAFDAFLIRRIINVPSVILANLVIGENVGVSSVHFEMMDDKTLWIGLRPNGTDDEVHVTVSANGRLSVQAHEA